MAQTSPWVPVPDAPPMSPVPAQMIAAAPNVIPNGVWASPAKNPAPTLQTVPPPKVDLHANLPQIFAPMPEAPQLDPNPQHQIAGHLTNKLQQDYAKDAAPKGFGGKIAHAFGADTRRGWEEQGLAKQINDITGDEAQNEERGAQTKNLGATAAKTNQETAMAPGKEASEEALRTSTIGNQQSEEEARQHPNWEHLETDQGIFALNPKTNELVPLTYQGQPLKGKPAAEKGQEHVSLTGPGGKPIAANYSPSTGKYTDTTGKEIANPQPYEKTPAAPGITMIVPDPNNPGGGIVQRLGAGSKVAPGAQTAAGINSENTATTQQRNVAAQAGLVHEQMPGVIADIQRNAAALGPISGRWNEFMQGKVGMDNPQMAGLRADLLMMSSAVALMHARGRLPENLREEFDRAINAPKQTPENLISTLNKIDQWTTANMNAMHGGQGGQVQSGSEPKVQQNSKGEYRYSTDGGKTWQAGKPNQ